jgi:hypothetical protein
MMALEIHQGPFKSAKRSVLDSHSLPGLQERPRSFRQPGLNESLDGTDFRGVNRHWLLPDSDNLYDSWRHKYGEPLKGVEPAKQVAGE